MYLLGDKSIFRSSAFKRLARSPLVSVLSRDSFRLLVPPRDVALRLGYPVSPVPWHCVVAVPALGRKCPVNPKAS